LKIFKNFAKALAKKKYFPLKKSGSLESQDVTIAIFSKILRKSRFFSKKNSKKEQFFVKIEK